MESVLDIVQLGEMSDATDVADPAGVHDGCADVIDQVFVEQLLRRPTRS